MPSVLITGANRGLGLEFARQYAADGWDVLATARDPAAAKELKTVKGQVEILPLDMTGADSFAALLNRIDGRPLSVVIGNAGVYGPKDGGQSFETIDYKAWLDTLNANTLGPMRLAVALRHNLRAAKVAGEAPKLAFVSSLMGSIADATSAGSYIYSSSKAALNMVGKRLSAELKEDGIVTLLLHPGWVETDMGGPQAPVKPSESIKGLRQVIADATMKTTGGFYDYKGKQLPW